MVSTHRANIVTGGEVAPGPSSPRADDSSGVSKQGDYLQIESFLLQELLHMLHPQPDGLDQLGGVDVTDPTHVGWVVAISI